MWATMRVETSLKVICPWSRCSAASSLRLKNNLKPGDGASNAKVFGADNAGDVGRIDITNFHEVAAMALLAQNC